ncbi:MAG TPA: hypothetical protein VL171_15100 [Verrucomicrobiae bacterium]|nr:hypothetical protein [Verrucomicrobiae bacterium]
MSQRIQETTGYNRRAARTERGTYILVMTYGDENGRGQTVSGGGELVYCRDA